MAACRDCKHCAREVESWELPNTWWWECAARTGYDALPSWPFESTKCRKFELPASVAATAAASEEVGR